MINVITNRNGLLNMTADTLQQTNQIFKMLLADDQARIEKTTTQGLTTATGLTWYDLQKGAKLLYPVLTPLRNDIPRVGGDGGTATNWKAITAVNVGNVSIGVSEGNRNAAMQTTEVDKVAKYVTIGLENFITFEGDEAAQNFDDAKALGSRTLLQAMMIGEEGVIIGGNASLALTTTPTPTVADIGSGGTINTGTVVSVICVALTFDGYVNATLAGSIIPSVTRTNADGSTDTYGGGCAQASAAGAVTTAANTDSVTAVVTPVAGAVGYAWFWGTAGNERIGAISTINSVLIKTAVGTGKSTLMGLAANLPAADNSKNALLFDGLITQICTAGSGAYVYAMPNGTLGTGTGLTSNSAGGIVEIDTALKSFWDNYRTTPEEILCNSQELGNITNKVIAGGGTPLFRFNVDGQNGTAADVTVTAGAIVGNYLNKFTMGGGELIKVRLHPNVPPGMIIFRRKSIPYPMSNVTNIAEMKCRRDYYQIAWPLKTRKYEFGVYASQVLAIYFLPAFGIIYNIANA